MTVDDFLNNHAKPFHDYIVRLCYRYSHDEYFHFSNEVLYSGSDDKHTWLNDWDEGYTEAFVIDFVDIDDMFIGFKK